MHVILPADHQQISAPEMDYIAASLGVPGNDQSQFIGLLSDPDAVDVILDNDQLFQRLVAGHDEHTLSTHLYFFITIRRALLEVGLDHRSLADYLANLLGAYAAAPRMKPDSAPEAIDTLYLVDLLRNVNKGSAESRFFIRSHIANYALYITGIFPERLRYKSKHRSMPDFAYYEELGQSNFQACAEDPLAWQFGLSEVYALLATHFRQVRMGLNQLAELQLYHGPLFLNHSVMLADVVEES